MFEVRGRFNTASVFAETVDNETMSQIVEMCNLESLKNERIAIMPDCHAGKGCTIGTTMTVKDAVIPAMVGVDIGCGVLTTTLPEMYIDFDELDNVIRGCIPCGQNVHSDWPNTDFSSEAIHRLYDLRCRDNVDINRAMLSIGTLGGGNHFIEVDRNENSGIPCLMVHSGSRYLGKQIAEYYQDLAARTCNSYDHRALIAQLKAAGKEKEISGILKANKRERIPHDLAHLTGELMNAYLHDMQIAQWYAAVNRYVITQRIAVCMGWDQDEMRSFNTVHNYIAPPERKGGSYTLRKGAVAANRNERLVIPLNMRDGALLCVGKGNKAWNCSAPHGAGRLLSRGKAKNTLTMDEYRKAMAHVWSTSVVESTIDEAPMAYKPADEIIAAIGDTVEIAARLIPLYNFKAS